MLNGNIVKIFIYEDFSLKWKYLDYKYKRRPSIKPWCLRKGSGFSKGDNPHTPTLGNAVAFRPFNTLATVISTLTEVGSQTVTQNYYIKMLARPSNPVS